jgi:hypothetical protein
MNYRSPLGTFGLLAVLLIFSRTQLLVAQVTSGSILGYVYDPMGKPVQHAEITITDKLHSFQRIIETDATGSYRSMALSPGVFTVSAKARGFESATRENLVLAVETQLKVDFHLALVGVKHTIEVTSPLVSVQTESSELGAVLSQDWIDSLPLNKRDFLQLAMLTPGVSPPVQGSELSSLGGVSMHANGGREEYNNYLLDGVDNNDPYVNRYVVQPPVDSIQEFKIATNSYSAEYGRSAAGQVNVITRRGDNVFHGSAYEYLRNKVLDASNYFDGPNKAPYIRNQFGFAAGGPIVKGKTFFFANVDFLRERLGLSQLSTVPTSDERNGNLSALGTTIYDPITGDPFPNNTIPPGDISPIASKILSLFPNPDPNRTGLVNNYLGQVVQPTNQTGTTFRVDHQITAVDDLTLRYNLGIVNLFEPFASGVNSVPGFGDYVNDHTHSAMVQYRHLFGARAVNTATLGYNRFSRDIMPQNYRVDVGKLWNVDWLNLPSRDFGYPSITVNGFSQIGDNTGYPILRQANTYQLTDGIALDRGRHLWKFGGEIRWLQLNGRVDLLSRGSISFPGYMSGTGLSDLLLGLPSFAMQAQVNNPIHLRSTAYAGYIQDNWKLRPNLTLNAGLRYEYDSPAIDPSNGMSELNLQTGQIVQVGTNGVTRSGIHPDRNNFAPRIGLSWNHAKDIVIRTGYGVYYDSGMFVVDSAAYFNPPQFVLQVFTPSSSQLLTLQDPYSAGAGIVPPASLSVLSPNLVTPYMQHWNLTVEKSIGRLGTLSVSYAGSKGTHLIGERDLNQPSPGSGDLQSRRPYQQYGNIFFIGSTAGSNFHALEIHFTRRMSSNISIWASYTYSHSIDTSSAFQGVSGIDPNFPQNSSNPGAERASSSFDMRHRFSVAYVLALPKNNRWTRNTEFQGIATLQSGQPFTPMLQSDNGNTGNGQFGFDRPNIVPGVSAKLSNPRVNEWFNTNAFVIPPAYTFGDAGRNCLRGPGYASFDTSLMRRIMLTERLKLTLEAQAFNLLNRTNFNLPQAFADQPDFGTITSAKAPRQLQFVARFSY